MYERTCPECNKILLHKSNYDCNFENDEVNYPIHFICRHFLYDWHGWGYKIIFVSGRKEKFRDQTIKFLEKSGFIPSEYILLMRKDNDNRPDEVIKKEIFQDNIQGRFFVEFVIDDRKKVKRMWVELGLFVLDVNQTDEEF